MLYVLVVAVLNIHNGAVDHYEQIGHGVAIEKCLQEPKGIEHPKDGFIKVYACVPEALLQESTT